MQYESLAAAPNGTKTSAVQTPKYFYLDDTLMQSKHLTFTTFSLQHVLQARCFGMNELSLVSIKIIN